MKRTIVCLALLAASCAAHPNEVEWADYGVTPELNPDYMAAWMAAVTPGEPHAELAKGVGSYTVSGQTWMASGQPPMPMEATATVEMILDGRYLLQHYESSFQGQTFKGVMLMGYDNLTEEYWNLWIDSMSTGYRLATGRAGEDGAIELHGSMRDPNTPEGRPYRTVMQEAGEDAFVLIMYDTLRDGSEMKVMELTYRKR
jgi:hypothetical protein